MYKIYADDALIYTPDVEELCLYNIVLTMEDNSAGTLAFTMTSGHPAFESLKKLATMIRVQDSSRTIWKGRVISDDRNIDNIKTVQCEGKLAFLNDSIFPEFEFSGAPDVLFSQIIDSHNRQVGEKQRLLPGNVTVKDKNDYIVRSSESALKTWKAVKEKCFQSSLGGHLQIRYEADGDHIDWLEDYQEISAQPISFGKNIIDLLVNTSATETYTAIRPQGASVDGKRISIADVNDGRDYIIDEEKAAEYGVIYAEPDESIWDDVTLPANLLRKAKEKLKTGIVLKKTIEVRAIDLNLTDEQTEALQVCTYVRVVSEPHGIEAWYLLSKVELHIDAPENTRYTLGAVKAALTDTNKETKSAIEKVMSTAIPTDVSQLNNDANYTTAPEVEKIINESGIAAPVISVVSETDDEYILEVRTAAETFHTPNLKGQEGAAGITAYELAVENGFAGTEAEWLASLKGEPGDTGRSAYEAAVDGGFRGTEAEWLASLKGEPGDTGRSAYEAAVDSGFTGTEAEWLASLKGKPGDTGHSAYEAAVDSGFTGTEAEWLASLKGEPGDTGRSAYEAAVDGGFTGTVEEWIASLKGEPGKDAAIKIDDVVGTDGDFLQYKNGKWTAAPIDELSDNREILSSPGDVQENKEPGKLVDALVIKQVFQFVSEGKRLIALAITDKGVDTSAEDTFAQMAENIGMIQGGAGGEGTVIKRIMNFSMPVPEGQRQITTVLLGLALDEELTVKSFAKANITVTEG